MFSERKEKELQELTPAAIEAQRKQRALNRWFGVLVIIGVLLLAMLIYEFVVIGKR